MAALESTIRRCADGELDLEEMGLLARKLAETRFDRRYSVESFINLLDEFMDRTERIPDFEPIPRKVAVG